MSNKVGYALLIHGCPVAASYNVTSAELVYFADFIADGGVFESSLASLPNVTQSVDPLGGFSKISDLSFDLLGQDFIRFFGTRKETVYTLSSDLLPGDVSIYLDGVTDGTSGLVYLPKETVEIGIVTSGVASILTRSVYSAFPESVSEYFPVSELVGGIDISLAAGHWNHYGRWVCLYRYDGEEWSIAYAGTIDGVSIQGLKTTLQTKSLTSLFERTLCNWTGKLERNQYTCPLSMEIKDYTGAVVGGLAETTSCWDIAAELESVSNDLANSRATYFSYVINPTRARIFKGGGSAPTESDCYDPANSHPALVEFLHLTSPTATTDYPDGFDMSDLSSIELEKYNFILLPGVTIAFDEQVSEPVRVDQYFLFDSGEKQIIVPCVYDSGTGVWTVDDDPAVPWFNSDGEIQHTDDNWLCLSTDTCTVKPVLTTGLTEDITWFIEQVFRRGKFPWYNALNLPSCLIDSGTFTAFGYGLKPVLDAETTLSDAFDSVLKIAGLSIVFEAGKLTCKRVQYLEDNGFLPEIGTDILLDEYPTFELGYVAPLSSLEIKYPKISKNYIFNMPDPCSGSLNKLSLEDIHSRWDHDVSEVAYRALYYFSKHTPTISIQTVSNAGNVGDLVQVTSKYLPSGLGLIEDTYTGLIVEKSESEIYEYKITLFPTPLTDFCMLAPSGFLDFTQGTYGKDNGYLHFTRDCNLTSFPKFLNSLGFPVLLDLLLVNNLGEFCILRDCQNDYENDQILWDNTWPTIMSGIDWAYLTTLPWESAS